MAVFHELHYVAVPICRQSCADGLGGGAVALLFYLNYGEDLNRAQKWVSLLMGSLLVGLVALAFDVENGFSPSGDGFYPALFTGIAWWVLTGLSLFYFRDREA